MHDPAAGKRQASLRGIQDQVRRRQRTLIAAKNSLLVEQSRLLERLWPVRRGLHTGFPPPTANDPRSGRDGPLRPDLEPLGSE